MMASSYSAKDEDGHITVSGPGGAALRNKKPENTAFKQQRLPAWQPILTAGTVLPAFFIIGLIFIPIGIGLYVTSNNIKEFEVPLIFLCEGFCTNGSRPQIISQHFHWDWPVDSGRLHQTPFKKTSVFTLSCHGGGFSLLQMMWHEHSLKDDVSVDNSANS